MVELTGEDLTHLAAFKARLRATRPAGRRSDTVQDLAVSLGAKGIAGIAPVLVRRVTRAAKLVAGDTEGRVPAVRPAHAPVLVEDVRQASHAVPGPQGFRAILAAARREAEQGRAKREHAHMADYLSPRREQVTQRVFAPVRRGVAEAEPPVAVKGRGVMARPGFARSASRVETVAGGAGRELGRLPLTAPASFGRMAEPEAVSGVLPEPVRTRQRSREAAADLEQALRAYFFRQSRLPPSGSVGFDPRLTPSWAGVKIPG